MRLADRLRSIVHPGGSAAQELQADPGSARLSDPEPCDQVAETLGGEWRKGGAGHPYLVVDRTYPAGYRLGRVAVADCLPATSGLLPRLGLLTTGASGMPIPAGRLLFLDLETTGLAGGAGTYAFLVGCGWFDGARFRVRQFVLTCFASERPLLEEVAELIRSAGVLITYNGKTFDAPLIDTRFLFHRLEAVCADLVHIDLLHLARRLWRPSVGCALDQESTTCRLSLIENSILGHVREDDVPGFEIPSRYFQYVRSGDARTLTAVLEHNRLDLLTLAMLTARAGQLLEEGAQAAQTAREALGLGRLYERGGMISDARGCFRRAIELEGDELTHAEALRSYAVLCRRERQHNESAAAWSRLLVIRGCPSRLAREALEALAIHHEHRSRDLCAAQQFAAQLQLHVNASRERAARHRLARIRRKIVATSPQPAQQVLSFQQ